MKDLKDMLQESLEINQAQEINEANSLIEIRGINLNKDDIDVNSTAEEISKRVKKAVDDVYKNNKPAKIKKMFPDADKNELADYKTIIDYFCTYAEAAADMLADNAAGDVDDLRDYVNGLIDPNELMSQAVDNMHNEYYDSDFKTEDWDTLVDNVSSNWNDVCKALTGKTWAE